MADILIKNIELKGSLLLTPKAIFKPVEEYDHEKIVQKWEIVKGAEIVPVPEHWDLIDNQKLIKELEKAWNVDDDQDFCNKSVWRIIERESAVVWRGQHD